MHRCDDAQLSESRVRHLAIHEMLRHDADHLSPRRQRAIGERTHQARAATAVHEASARLGEKLSHRRRLPDIRRIDTGICRAEHAHGTERHGAVRSSRMIPDIRLMAARRFSGMKRDTNRQNPIIRISRFSRLASSIIE